MKGRIAAIVMAVLLLLYLVIVGERAILFMSSGDGVGIAIGVALVVLPVLGAWALARELQFGARSEKLVHILSSEGALPVDDLPHHPSGRPVREAADAEFPRYQSEVDADPDSWRAWFRLGLAYDASGDRRRARRAIREAIALNRAAKKQHASPDPG